MSSPSAPMYELRTEPVSFSLPTGVALGKVVEYGYEGAAALAKHLAKAPAAAKA